MSLIDDIEKLDALKRRGSINELEYQQAKAAILSERMRQQSAPMAMVPMDEKNVNMWAMLFHLSHFCGYVVPFAGLVVPIVLWQLKKNDSPLLDDHGKVLANWIITECILACVFALLCALLIGIPLLYALAAAGFIFPIIGAVKASSGVLWVYPLSIRFFK